MTRDCCGNEPRPGQRKVECNDCEENFHVEDGPVCPYCGHDHSEEVENDG